MTLDDFFTLSEMNNGLTAPSRVRGLLAVMQAERDSVVQNIGDSTRQWSAVASAIAATKNKDCLDLFIQLDGLHFINKWLGDAQKFSNDSSDSFVEESIAHLLLALEKLHVDYEKIVACQIWTTVKDLLVHRSSMVNNKARGLFESWKMESDNDAPLSDVERALIDKAGETAYIVRDSGHVEPSLEDASLSVETFAKEKGQESPNHDQVLRSSSDAVHIGKVEGSNISDEIAEAPQEDKVPVDHVVPSLLPKPSLEPLVHHPINSTSTESCSQAVSGEDACHGRSEFHELESVGVKPPPKAENLPEKLVSLEASEISEDENLPSTCASVHLKSVAEPSSEKEFVDEKKLCEKCSPYPDSLKIVSDGNGSVDDHPYANQTRNSNAFYAREGGEFNHHMLFKTSEDGKIEQSPKDLRTFLSAFGDDRKIHKLERHISGSGLANNYNFSRKKADSEPDLIDKKSEVDLEYGIVDPLEFARQVAIEVEREVVDYQEQSCSSSDKAPEVSEQKPDSPESGKQTHTSECSLEEVTNDPDLSADSSPVPEESATSTLDLEAKQTNGAQEMATSQVTETVQTAVNTEKDLCTFDLNEEICSEDGDHTANQISAPVSIVSASRAAAAPGLPFAPLQFEGNLGWKGSAATSAFRPASPRRIPESKKDLSTGGSSSSSKQRQGWLDIDLNMTESFDGRMGDLSPDKHVPVSCSLPSGESSVETNSRRSERLELDLNHVSEDDATPSDLRIGQFFPLGNFHPTQSHSSSSSSKQATLRIIDLNDQPSFQNDSSDNSFLGKLSHKLNLPGAIKSDDSAISIMGTRVEVNRKDIVSQSAPSPNGKTPELALDINLGRPANFFGVGSVLPYAPSCSAYGYNNITSGPTLPFSSTIYGSSGPFPYMVDSRGAPVIPQIVGSASAPPSTFSQLPFYINMNSSTPLGVGPSRSSFDLNSGMMVENGNENPAGFVQFLSSSQVRSVEEQMRSNSQFTSSSVGGKRKEPDGGWENYPLKHFMPPWK